MCGHVCIIRGKPITARNACQAVKCYPRPWPGGLMISWGIFGVSSARLHPFPFPSISSLSLFLSRLLYPFTTARDALSLRSLLPLLAIRLHLSAMRSMLLPLKRLSVPPDYRDNLQEWLSTADMKSLLRTTV